MMKMLHYKNDPWLLDGETANDLILAGKHNFVFIVQKSRVLNFFSAFVKKSDFLKQDKINQPLQKTIYTKVSPVLRQILSERCSDKKALKATIERYIKRRSNCDAAILRWFKTNVFPLFVLRILSRDKQEFSQWTSQLIYLTDFLNKSSFYAPKTIEEALH